ncbi:MAG: hypothetical protein N2595_03905 [bacterium]|nr:hypothetical protein [bacterium]
MNTGRAAVLRSAARHVKEGPLVYAKSVLLRSQRASVTPQTRSRAWSAQWCDCVAARAAYK